MMQVMQKMWWHDKRCIFLHTFRQFWQTVSGSSSLVVVASEDVVDIDIVGGTKEESSEIKVSDLRHSFSVTIPFLRKNKKIRSYQKVKKLHRGRLICGEIAQRI